TSRAAASLRGTGSSACGPSQPFQQPTPTSTTDAYPTRRGQGTGIPRRMDRVPGPWPQPEPLGMGGQPGAGGKGNSCTGFGAGRRQDYVEATWIPKVLTPGMYIWPDM